MTAATNYKAALASLRAVYDKRDRDNELRSLIDSWEDVAGRYRPMFSREGIEEMTEEDFHSFLLFRNNRHWTGLQRIGTKAAGDIKKLRRALLELIDDETPVEKRLNNLIPKGRARVTGLAKAILTPILMIQFPDKYGVWNGTSESAMNSLGLWPKFDRGISIGKKYTAVNAIMTRVAADLGVSLWTLDALWWRAAEPSTSGLDDGPENVDEDNHKFGLERHLHDFLLDNWDHTELGKHWSLDEEGGDIKGYGYERYTNIGKIDLLARHKTQKKWLVVELKRNQSDDATVGQALRYMGWVQENLAEKNDKVEGLIISHEGSEKLRYALTRVPDVSFMRYRVDFTLLKDGDS